MSTGTDTPPPSTLVGLVVENVVTPPLSLATTTSVEVSWLNDTMVSALAEDPIRSIAAHANAKERRKNRESESC
jgi:hypothetical protein